MLSIAYVLCALAGGLVLLMTWGARPTRGENLTAAHLVTGPIAIVFVLGGVLVQIAAPLPMFLANVVLGFAWPGTLVAMTFLPLGASSRRHALVPKVAAPLIVGSPFLLGLGPLLHPAMPWAGAGVLTLVGAYGGYVVVVDPLRRWVLRQVNSLRPRQPSEWERNQAEWQRGEWRKVPADAPIATLLQHARSLAPDVREACHARLAAHTELAAGVVDALRSADPSYALHYVTHNVPHSRADFAPAINELLATLRRTWPKRLRNDSHPNPWTGDLIPAFDCAIAVLVAGGDTRAELRAWQEELASMPKFQGTAKELARWLKKAG